MNHFKWEAYRDQCGKPSTFLPHDSPNKDMSWFKEELAEGHALHATITAETYNELMQKYYDLNGWGEYSPMKEVADE